MDESEIKERIEELEQIAHSDLNRKLDRLLAKESLEVQLGVRETIDTWNIDPEDPYFIILIRCKIVQIICDVTPNRIKGSFEAGLIEVRQVLEEYQRSLLEIQRSRLEEISQAALKQSTAQLNKAIANILEDNNISSKKNRFSPRVIGAMVTAGGMITTLIIGAIGGRLFDRTAVAQNWKNNLEAEEREFLEWAKSSEGQFAKNIFTWNEDLYSKTCAKKAQNLGITFTDGSLEQTEGFCVIDIVPESQRKYRPRN